MVSQIEGVIKEIKRIRGRIREEQVEERKEVRIHKKQKNSIHKKNIFQVQVRRQLVFAIPFHHNIT